MAVMTVRGASARTRTPGRGRGLWDGRAGVRIGTRGRKWRGPGVKSRLGD